jgi:YggT family protein
VVVLHLLAVVVEVFVVVLIVRALLSWIPVRPGSPVLGVQRVLATVTEPVLRPVRRIIPPLRAGGMGIDISFMVVILVAQIIVIPLLRS